jgi:hypothetical protein
MSKARKQSVDNLVAQPDTYLEFLTLRSKRGRTGVFTATTIPDQAVILHMQGALLAEPNLYSIQIDETRHLGQGGLIDDEMNHACVANAYIDFSNLKHIRIRAARAISRDEEVTINYCATEDILAEPFECDCGSTLCYGRVKGFRFLAASQQQELVRYLSPYLLQRYAPF